jgi:hypothetical protein
MPRALHCQAVFVLCDYRTSLTVPTLLNVFEVLNAASPSQLNLSRHSCVLSLAITSSASSSYSVEA